MHFAEWTFLRVGNGATSNRLVVAGHNLHHKWSKATATCHGHTISPRAAVCMPSFLWYALLPCPYLSNVSFQLSSVQGIALEQMGMGVLARTASEKRVKKTSNGHVWCNPSEVKYRVFILPYSSILYHMCRDVFYGPAFHPSPSSKRVPSPRGRAPACCSSDRCSWHQGVTTGPSSTLLRTVVSPIPGKPPSIPINHDGW